LAKEVSEMCENMLRDARPGQDLQEISTRAEGIAKEIKAPRPILGPALRLGLLADQLTYVTAPRDQRVFAELDGAEVSTVAKPSAATLGARLKGLDYWFFFGSGLLVIASGMSALYVPNATFGSFGDYLGVFVWGSTVQAGINFVRRLIPGASKSLVGT
jgi:hypothetical protein